MKNPFEIGDTKAYIKQVKAEDVARFESGIVHEVYSTFALTRDAEWSGRLFVLEMKEPDEEGIGTYISAEHKSPAFVGEEVKFVATLIEVGNTEVVTSYTASVGDRLVAVGRQKQRILSQEKIEKVFDAVRDEP